MLVVRLDVTPACENSRNLSVPYQLLSVLTDMLLMPEQKKSHVARCQMKKMFLLMLEQNKNLGAKKVTRPTFSPFQTHLRGISFVIKLFIVLNALVPLCFVLVFMIIVQNLHRYDKQRNLCDEIITRQQKLIEGKSKAVL